MRLGQRLELLWADDQRQVAAGLARNLDSSLVRTTFCDSGDAALEQVARHYFDLLILDLAMPPGRWGGLTVLERLKDQNIRLPVLVLSGEGTQTETIQAMRLGAHNYVLKEQADIELRGAIQETVKQYWSSVISNAQLVLPTPLAVPVASYAAAEGNVTRFRRLIDYFEALTRFSAIVLASEDEHRNVLAAFARPSFGTWNELRRRLLSVNAAHRPVDQQILAAIDDSMLGDLIAYRNDLAHVGEPSSADCELHLRKLAPALERSLRILLQRLTGRIVHISSLRLPDGRFEVLGREISGIDAVFKPFNSSHSEPLKCPRTYWQDADQYYDLEPLLLTRIVSDCWRVYVYDGYKASKPSGPDGSEDLRYIDVLSTKRQESLGEYTTSDLGLCTL